MSDRRCVECGVALRGRGRRLYCSDDCKLITRTCATCGDEFKVQRKRKGRNFVCSLSCRPVRKWGNPPVDVSCQGCGATMSVYPSQLNEGRGKYCSRSCSAFHRPISGKPSKIADAAINEFLGMTPLLCELEKRLGRWSVDMALPLHSIAVELDGEYWHGLPAMVEKDRRKDEWMNAHGWRVIRISIGRDDTPQSIARRIAEELDSCLTATA